MWPMHVWLFVEKQHGGCRWTFAVVSHGMCGLVAAHVSCRDWLVVMAAAGTVKVGINRTTAVNAITLQK